MKRLMLLLACLPLWAIAAESAEEIKKDVQRHRAMATAHEAAAKCLESGKKTTNARKNCRPPARAWP